MRRTRFRGEPVCVAALLCAAAAGAARAQVSPAQALLDSAFVGSIGGFVVSTDTRARLNGSSSTNPDVDFDETFGNGSDSTRIRADALWRITPAHHLRFMYFDNTSDRSRNIERNVQWGDYTFQAGGRVEAQTKFRIFELAYEYAFMRQPDFELSGTLGVHYMDLKTRLSGNATITDGQGNVSVAASRPRRAPCRAAAGDRPARRLGRRTAVVPRRPGPVLQGQDRRLRRPSRGPARQRDLDVQPELGLGVGYNRFVTTVDLEKDSFDGQARLGYGAPAVRDRHVLSRRARRRGRRRAPLAPKSNVGPASDR